ncbi:MAG: hypothetical protein FD152_1042, partial [Xanthobacteraceae bacterium]
MRLVVGCTLEEPEIDAIIRGETLRATVEHKIVANPVHPEMVDDLEL